MYPLTGVKIINGVSVITIIRIIIVSISVTSYLVNYTTNPPPTTSNGRGGWTGYFLNFTSQQWLSSEQVSRPEWWHIMVVIVPEILISKDTTILWLTGKITR